MRRYLTLIEFSLKLSIIQLGGDPVKIPMYERFKLTNLLKWSEIIFPILAVHFSITTFLSFSALQVSYRISQDFNCLSLVIQGSNSLYSLPCHPNWMTGQAKEYKERTRLLF